MAVTEPQEKGADGAVKMGRYKWKTLGIEYTLEDAQPPTTEAVERARALFQAAGLKTY
jgi:pyruvate formate lyase activating enzyme